MAQFSLLRSRLAVTGAECRVVKNTFLRRAAKEAGLPEMGELNGPDGDHRRQQGHCSDREGAQDFAAEFQKPVLKVGVVDRAVISTEQIKAIADLPSREVLLAQFLGLLQSPASKLVRLLNEPASSLARALKAKSEKQG